VRRRTIEGGGMGAKGDRGRIGRVIDRGNHPLSLAWERGGRETIDKH